MEEKTELQKNKLPKPTQPRFKSNLPKMPASTFKHLPLSSAFVRLYLEIIREKYMIISHYKRMINAGKEPVILKYHRVQGDSNLSVLSLCSLLPSNGPGN
jgi:hypothetical protein